MSRKRYVQVDPIVLDAYLFQLHNGGEPSLSQYMGLGRNQYPSLKGMDLSNKDFKGAKLKGTDMSFCKLEKTKFSHADLKNVNLTEVNAPGVIMDHAELIHTKMRRGNFQGAIFDNVWFGGVDCYGADMRGASFNNAGLYGVNFRGADFSGADLRVDEWAGGHVRQTLFLDVTLNPGADIGHKYFKKAITTHDQLLNMDVEQVISPYYIGRALMGKAFAIRGEIDTVKQKLQNESKDLERYGRNEQKGDTKKLNKILGERVKIGDDPKIRDNNEDLPYTEKANTIEKHFGTVKTTTPPHELALKREVVKPQLQSITLALAHPESKLDGNDPKLSLANLPPIVKGEILKHLAPELSTQQIGGLVRGIQKTKGSYRQRVENEQKNKDNNPKKQK